MVVESLFSPKKPNFIKQWPQLLICSGCWLLAWAIRVIWDVPTDCNFRFSHNFPKETNIPHFSHKSTNIILFLFHPSDIFHMFSMWTTFNLIITVRYFLTVLLLSMYISICSDWRTSFKKLWYVYINFSSSTSDGEVYSGLKLFYFHHLEVKK